MPVELAKKLLGPGSVEMRPIVSVLRRRYRFLNMASSFQIQIHRRIAIVDFLHGDDKVTGSLLRLGV